MLPQHQNMSASTATKAALQNLSLRAAPRCKLFGKLSFLMARIARFHPFEMPSRTRAKRECATLFVDNENTKLHNDIHVYCPDPDKQSEPFENGTHE